MAGKAFKKLKESQTPERANEVRKEIEKVLKKDNMKEESEFDPKKAAEEVSNKLIEIIFPKEEQIIKSLGFKSSHDIQTNLNGYNHLINASDIINSCKWLLKNGFEICQATRIQQLESELSACREELKKRDEEIGRLEKEIEETILILRELSMREKYCFPENNQDNQWFNEGTESKPELFSVLCKKLGLGLID